MPELGLYYYMARYYSPTLGRFMQTDPIGYGDGLNWYNYVGGDPINFVDPWGTYIECKIETTGKYDEKTGTIIATGKTHCAENGLSSDKYSALIIWWQKNIDKRGPEILGSFQGDKVILVFPNKKITCPGSSIDTFTASPDQFGDGDPAHLHNPESDEISREVTPGPDDGQTANMTGVSFVGTTDALYIIQRDANGQYSIGLLSGRLGPRSVINKRLQTWNKNNGKGGPKLARDQSKGCTVTNR